MRPRYHYAPAANWLSDPNGLVHHAGVWHMFYQYNPLGEDWGHMAWGHATSTDLATWIELPPALLEDDRHMIYSGSAVVDRANSAGFGADAIVAVYTGAREHPVKHQAQCLAWSGDGGKVWTKFAANPVLDRGLADFRDPNVIWHEATARWIMVVVLSEEDRALLYASPNLRDWTQLSQIALPGVPGHLWECPLLIELPVEGCAQTRWLFKVDVLSGAPGSGACYVAGTFDGERFAPDGDWHLADLGSDFYAAIAWHAPRDARGRPCWIGWMGNHGYQRKLPLQGWRGAMSLPRRLSLRPGEGGMTLVQEIEPSCAALFGPLRLLLPERGGTDIPAAARLRLDAAGEDWSLAVTGEAGRSIRLSASPGRLTVIRRDAVTPELDAVYDAAFDPHSPIDLWIDVGSIELLANGGALSLTLQHRLDAETLRLETDRAIAIAALA